MGLLCLKLLVAEGVKTIVAGAPGDEARLNAASRFGAATVVNVGQQSLLDTVREETAGVGVDAGVRMCRPPQFGARLVSRPCAPWGTTRK